MKKQSYLLSFIFSVLLLFVASSMQAAPPYQLPDSSFEDWSDTFNGQPAPGATWNAANIHKVALGINVYGQVAHRVTDAHSGTYAAKLIDTEVGAAGITEISPSWITLGTPWAYINGLATGSATAGTDGGIAFTARPDTMSVWIKRWRANGSDENFNLVYYAWKGQSKGTKYKNKDGGCESTGAHYDEESDIRRDEDPNICGTDVRAEHIADGFVRQSANYSNWTKIKVPITYKSDLIPEKMNIILSASNYPEGRRNDGLGKGNYMIVDDLNLEYSSQVYSIVLDNKPMDGFSKDNYNYTIELPEDATDASTPANIVCKRSGRTLSGSEISIDNPRKLGQPVTITVKAEDGSSTSVYTLTFVRKLWEIAEPQAILVNGTPINGFAGSLTSYDVALPYGTTQAPEITIVKGHETQTYSVQTCSNFPCGASVTVYAENTNVSKTYTLNLSIAPLNDATLQDILVNGKSISGFTPNKFIYKVSVPLGTTQDPTLEPISKYEPGLQTIEVTDGGLNGESTIKVSVPSGASKTYKITYVIAKSDYKYLNDLKVGGNSIADFAPEKQDYTYTLPVGTTQLPEVTWVAGDEYQTITTTDEGVNGTTRVTVTAQNGDVFIYRIKFSVEKSSNTLLKNILVDGVALNGFVPEQKEYTYNVAGTATIRPVVTWEKGDDYQMVTKNPSSEATAPVNGITKLTVRAQDNSTSVYSIAFTQTLSDNSTLSDLWVEGATLSPQFTADNTAYTCELPRGTTVLPTIGYTKGDASQVVRVDEKGINGTAKITVKAQTGATTVYTIAFSVYASSNASLSGILVDDVMVPNFDKDVLHYDVVLPSGTTELPAIEAIKGDEAQRVLITKGGVNGTTSLRVIAENGAEQVYTLAFTVEKSLNASLRDILVGGVSLADFSADQLEYRYILADDVTACPMVDAVGEPGQTITITMPKQLGVAYIEVQPEVGGKNIYTIRFTHQQSAITQLSDLTIDGVTIDGFDPAIANYQVNLPVGTKAVPAIGYTTADDKQTVQVLQQGVNAPAYVYVMAEDGTVGTYTITFNVPLSNEARLSAIKLDGEGIQGFDPDTYSYAVTLEEGTTQLPVLTYEKGCAAQQVSVIMPALQGKAVLVVTSEDRTQTQTYEVAFDFAVQTDATLKNILVDGVTVDGFAPDNADYELTYQKGTALPVITYEKQHATQQVVVNNQGTLGCDITVTAQDGSQHTYHITYRVEADSKALLSDIKLYDAVMQQYVSLADFAADKLEYDIELPWRTAFVPAIMPVPGAKGQVITLDEGGVNGTTTIRVLAENGTDSAVYTLRFATQKSDVNTLEAIMIGDEFLNIDEDTIRVVLPYGTTQVPAITYTKQQTEQKVVLVEGGLNEVSTIKVTAENGDENTYVIAFSVAPSAKANVLRAILLDGTEIALQDNVFSYDITLPYGVTTLPVLSYFKNYDEQEVRVVQTPVGYQLTVVANQEGVANTTYSIHVKLAENTAVLTSLTLAEGTLYPAFRPDVTSYVAKISNDNGVTPVCDDQNTITVLESTAKKYQIKVSSKANADMSTVYTVYFYYQGDVIPNGEFTNWTTAKYNNANKPVGWQVPADADDVYLWTAKTGSEVVKTNDTTVGFKTAYWMALGGTIPPVMTLGTIGIKWGVANSTKINVSGGITFRNTPDYANINYYFKKKGGSQDERGALFAFMFDDVPCDYLTRTITNSYVEYKHKLNLDGKVPSKMNITIYGAGDNDSQVTAGDELYVDYIRFEYSSAINSITVNGVAATKNGNTFTATIASNYVGLPQISIVGEVEDQGYDITWSKEENGKRTATIRSYAEDATYTDYTLEVNRATDINNLSSLLVNGVIVDGFTPDQTNYEVKVPCTLRQLPDVQAVTVSAYQTAQFAAQNNLLLPSVNEQNSVITITSIAENGDPKDYTITFVKEKSSDATLQNIMVNNVPLSGFAPDKTTYTIELPEGTTEAPVITYVKQSDAQGVTLMDSVLVTGSTIKVTAEDGQTSKTYTLTYRVEPSATTAQLNGLSVLNAAALNFDAATYDYATVLNSGETFASVWYSKLSAMDTLQMVLTDDTAFVALKNVALTNTYTVALTRVLSDNAYLSTILVDGVAMEEFLPEGDEFYIEAHDGISIEPVLAEEGQQMTIAFDQATQIYTITVTALAGNSHEYKLTLQEPIRTNVDLAGILIDGVMLDGFNKDILSYSYVIPCDMPKWTDPTMPDIQAIAAAEGQVISIEVGNIDGTSYITVRNKEGEEKATLSKEYRIDFTPQPSSYVFLNSIAANYTVLPDFDAQKTMSYNVDVPVGQPKPVITYEKGDAFQQVTESDNGNQKTLLVTAQDSSQLAYVINYITHYTGDANLAAITLDGQLLEEFAPDKYTGYQVELEVGTTLLPQIRAIAGADGQTVTIHSDGVNGETVITVTADDGETTKEYRIQFTVKLSDNATLTDLIVGEESVSAHYAPDAMNYTHVLPVSPREWSMVAWVPGDIYQRVDTIERVMDTWNKELVLFVTAQDGVHKNTYTLQLQIAKSDVDTLQAIYFDDVEYELFDPRTADTIVYELPVGTTEYPTVTYREGDEFQTVEQVVDGDKVTLKVTAENEAARTYVIQFVVLHSDNVDLNAIYVGYEPLPGFKADSLSYNYVLPYGTTELPVVEVEKGESWQQITTQSGGVNGDYIIHVVAEDGITERDYIIHFSVAKSDNALLKDVLINSESLKGFDSEIFTYTVDLPYATEQVPLVEGVKTIEGQTVEVVNAATLADTTFVVVTAEDGITQQTYSFAWNVLPSSNAYLQMIYLNGEPMPDFDPEEPYYDHVEVPYGTTQWPEVTWLEGDKDQKVTLEMNDNVALLKVEAQDGENYNEYQLTFVIAKSTENRLKNIYLKGEAIVNYNPDETKWNVVYPNGTPQSELATIEDVTYEVFNPTEQVEVMSSDDVLILLVTAENGDIRVYEITQEIALSSNTRLDDILINGESLPGFDPDVLEYVYVLPYGSTSAPNDIQYISSDETQSVSLLINPISDPTQIFVTAEDGTVVVYSIQFVPDDFDPSSTPTIDNVCVTSRADNTWKFTTNCTGIILYLSTLDGKILLKANLPLVDPNVPEICSEEANGFILDQALDRVIAYYFVHQNKTIVKSGKIRVSQQ